MCGGGEHLEMKEVMKSVETLFTTLKNSQLVTMGWSNSKKKKGCHP